MATSFPACNSIVERRMRRRRNEDYKERLRRTKPNLNIKPPREFHHLQLQVNKVQLEQERQAEIARQNQQILEKLVEIKQSPARVDHQNMSYKPKKDRLKRYRERRMRVINRENRLMEKRIQNTEPYYDLGEWERDYEKHLYYLSLMGNTTKDYDEVDEGYERRESYSSDEEEVEATEEEDETEKPQDKLPPLTDKKKQQEKSTKKGKEKEKVNLPPIDGKKKGKDMSNDLLSEDALCQHVEDLHDAFQREDRDRILEITGKVSEKLEKVKKKYKEMHDGDLIEALMKYMDEDSQKALKALDCSAEDDATRLYEAMKGLGTDEDELIEILCTRSNTEMARIKEVYNKKYGRTLEADLKGDLSGDLEVLLIELCKGARDETSKVDKELAKSDAKDLWEAGAKTWSTDEGQFIRVFTQRSFPQLRPMFPEYKKLAKVEIAASIDSEMDGDLQKAFLTLVSCAQNPSKFYAKKLYQALQESDNVAVSRIVLGKDKDVLDRFTASYKAEHKRELADDTDKYCSGDTRKLLLAKLGKTNKQKQKEEKGKKDTNAKASPKKKKEETAVKKDSKKTDNAKVDCDELHKAIQETDKDNIVDILARNCDEKSKTTKLRDRYEQEYQQILLEALKIKLGEELHDAVECLLLDSACYDAKCLYNATKGLGTDEDMLVEVLCSRTNDELAAIKQKYSEQYKSSLESDIKGDTSGNFEDFLVTLCMGKRDESAKVDKGLVKKDAEALAQAGILKAIGTDEDQFVKILTARSRHHLHAVFIEYRQLTGEDLDESILKEMSGDLEKGFLAIVKCSRDPSKFYADKLHGFVVSGDIASLARVILSISKDELAMVVAAYKKHHEKNLEDELDEKCSEHMKKLLRAKMGLKGENDKRKQPKGKDNKAKPAASKSSTVKKDSKGVGDKNKAAANKKVDECDQLQIAIEDNKREQIKEIISKNLTDKAKLKKLADNYNKRNKQELLEALEQKVEEDIHEAVAAQLLSPDQYRARSIYQAMKGVGTNEQLLIEMLCPLSNAEIAAMKKEYQKKYGKPVEEDIRDETHGEFEKLLVELCKGQRDESKDVNEMLAHKDAEALLEAGIKQWGTNEEKFVEIFTVRSIAQLKVMLPEYKQWAKCDIEDSLDSEMTGNLRDGLKALVACIRDSNKMKVDKLHTCLQGGDTKTAVRIVLGAKGDELKEIQGNYNYFYKPTLAEEVEKRCSDVLKSVMLPKLKDNVLDEEEQQNLVEEKEKNSRPKLDVTKVEYHGTLKAAENFDAAADAEALKKAMNGFGSDEDRILGILGGRDSEQRQQIAAKFKEKFDKDLVEELKTELSGKFEEAIVAVMLPPDLYDANSLQDAMKGLGTNEDVLVEILCSRSNEEIQAIKTRYKKAHNKDLVEDVSSETSGDLQTLLLKLLEATRDTSNAIDEDLAYKDATHLYEAGDGKWGTDECAFITILTTRSPMQLKATFEAYTHVANIDFMKSVDDELTGNFQDSVKAIVRCTRNTPLYFAEVLNKAMSGVVGDTKTVTRVVVSRCEIDLVEIKSAYEQKFGEPLADAVRDRLKGDHEQLLLKLLGTS